METRKPELIIEFRLSWENGTMVVAARKSQFLHQSSQIIIKVNFSLGGKPEVVTNLIRQMVLKCDEHLQKQLCDQ